MNLLPQASGTRPRLACEISPQGVVAARAETPAAPLSAVTRVKLEAGAVVPSLKPGNIVDRVAVSAALRKTLEDAGVRSNSRGADLTLIIPDAAVRVLLLDFDALPSRLSEALPIVRFRLKKLLPFDADDAMVSFQVMSTSKQIVRVLAVAIPRDVLSEYETAAREAGFEPGAVLPSTLACLAALDDADGAALLVNAHATGVTTAIVRSGILLLHRSVDMQAPAVGTPANIPPAMFESSGVTQTTAATLPLVDRDHTAGEWASQQALPEHGRSPYAYRDDARPVEAAVEPAPITHSPYASPSLDADFNAELHQAILVAPTSMRDFAVEAVSDTALSAPAPPVSESWTAAPTSAHPGDISKDIAEAVNVAAAYFEDTLAQAPTRILCAGPLGADALAQILSREGMAASRSSNSDGFIVRELVSRGALAAGAATSSIPPGWMAGVLGALRG